MTDTIERLDLGWNEKAQTKKKYAIDGEKNRILEIDLQDISITSRIKPAMEKTERVQSNWDGLRDLDPDNLTEDEAAQLEAAYEKAEAEMREAIDYLFNANVSEVMLKDTSAFTPVNGRLKYDILVSALSEKYGDTIKREMGKFNVGKVNKRVQKYIGKK